MSARPIRTFSIGFREPGYNEADHAGAVARHLGTDHTELYVSGRDAMDVIPALPGIYCEPFSDSSQIPTYLVARLARGHVTVALSGDGGDELFSGYTRYRLADRLWRRLASIPLPLRRAAAGALTALSPARYDRMARPLSAISGRRVDRLGDNIHKAAALLPLADLDAVYRQLCSHWSAPDDLVIGGREAPTMLTGLEAPPRLAGAVERMMYTDLVSYLPDDILVKVDRAAMAVSLETRMPLLDHRLAEFAMSLPLSITRAGAVPKWPLRQILYRHVPPALIERPKMGFAIPIDSWLRGPLRDWAEDLMDERRLACEGFFNPGPVREAWHQHLAGRRNNQYLLWDVLMFQSWLADQTVTSDARVA